MIDQWGGPCSLGFSNSHPIDEPPPRDRDILIYCGTCCRHLSHGAHTSLAMRPDEGLQSAGDLGKGRARIGVVVEAQSAERRVGRPDREAGRGIE